ncbi:hypothetical protein Tco_0939217 [Tanacetum coccineum]|uniref:Uncharacterized protein n=1 Tax=Tanacetum coccineum TaxID=301880 RepID=A0ABQ5DK90_9ASTR
MDHFILLSFFVGLWEWNELKINLLLYICSGYLKRVLIVYIFFKDPIGQRYGLTETCAGAAFSEADDNFVGCVGPPLPYAYIKVDESGMRWFYTGDMGGVHPDGCLEIIDKKNCRGKKWLVSPCQEEDSESF